MANVSLKTDFQNGDKLYDYELNNNFRAIKAALEAMNKITWQDNEEGVGVSAYKGNTESIEARELIDGQLLYNTETGETYIDTYVDDNLVRINTGSGNVVAIQETEPTNEAVKLWIEEDTLDTLGTEIVDEYSESTQLGYSAAYINSALNDIDDTFDSGIQTATVLFSGSTTDDVNLSDSIANYDYIEVYGTDNINTDTNFYAKVPVSNNLFTLQAVEISNTTDWTLWVIHLSMSGTKITRGKTYTRLGSMEIISEQTTRAPITRVVGYKAIQISSQEEEE